MEKYNPQSQEYLEAYWQAERQVKAKIGFYWHLGSYLVVNGFLVLIYLTTSLGNGGLDYPWFIWPMAGWGVGLILHFLGVFVFNSTGSQQKMIAKELNKMGVTPSGQPVIRPPAPYIQPPFEMRSTAPYPPPPAPETRLPDPYTPPFQDQSNAEMAGRK